MNVTPDGVRSPRRVLGVLERHNFVDWKLRHEAGQAAGMMPYGLERLAERFELWHPDVNLGPLLSKLFEAVNYHWDRETAEIVLGLRRLRDVDVVLSLFEDFALTYSAIDRRLVRLPPMVVMICWAAQRLLTFAHKQREALRRTCQSAAALTVFSDNQVGLLSSRLLIPTEKITVVDFGVDVDYFLPGGSGEGYVAVAGQDVGRDWQTFAKVASQAQDLRFKVAAWPNDLRSFHFSANVELLGGLSTPLYRALLQGADSVFVPTHPLPYPTGQSVMLEALSCERPVVLSASTAMQAYIDRSGALSFPPGDPSTAANLLRQLQASPALRQELGEQGRCAVRAYFNVDRMWTTVEELIRHCL